MNFPRSSKLRRCGFCRDHHYCGDFRYCRICRDCSVVAESLEITKIAEIAQNADIANFAEIAEIAAIAIKADASDAVGVLEIGGFSEFFEIVEKPTSARLAIFRRLPILPRLQGWLIMPKLGRKTISPQAVTRNHEDVCFQGSASFSDRSQKLYQRIHRSRYTHSVNQIKFFLKIPTSSYLM